MNARSPRLERLAECGLSFGLSVEPPQPDTVWHAVDRQG